MIELTKEYIDHLKDIITEKDDAKIKEILDLSLIHISEPTRPY